ncbi:hypothetical protein IFR04_001695 [Cadophora malorum]|uniref:Uncharacterized protein n=1 Tax=Cadophora malorum TaxID=108018 RepID=A0A8H7WHM0_9HELO|nr:hypothetical protein IFR04_001695 [Cadophora malorum]
MCKLEVPLHQCSCVEKSCKNCEVDDSSTQPKNQTQSCVNSHSETQASSPTVNITTPVANDKKAAATKVMTIMIRDVFEHLESYLIDSSNNKTAVNLPETWSLENYLDV